MDIPSDVTPSFWLLPLEVVTVQGQSVQIPTGNDALAAIDTGTTLVAGPSDGVASIYNAIEGSQALEGQMEGFFSYRTFILQVLFRIVLSHSLSMMISLLNDRKRHAQLWITHLGDLKL